MSRLFDQLLRQRGISADFLMPKYEEMLNPFLLPDMEKAVARIEKALKKHENILIYGDYDVDGVTASTIMREALQLAQEKNAKQDGNSSNRSKKSQFNVMLPNRFTDGYGMSTRILDFARDNQINLVITVDCGSSNHEIVDALNQQGVDVIITDHHECRDALPAAVAVVNPKRKDAMELAAKINPEEAEKAQDLRDLCGAGVAFKVAQALVQRGMIAEGQEKWLLDLAMIGTLCDSMPISCENRRICYYGMTVLTKTRRPGLKELLSVAGVRKLSGEAIGFQVGPRLNAAGRMESPDLAYQLLNAETRAEAAELAERLNSLNTKRRDSQQEAVSEIAERELDDEPVIVVKGAWHEGILGIIAGRLVEEYQKPAFVLAEIEQTVPIDEVGAHKVSAQIDEKDAQGETQIILKGSGRSFGEYSLAEALKYAKDVIIGGGGHAEACGAKLKLEQFADFKQKVNEYYRSLKLENQARFLDIHEDLEIEDLSELTLEFLAELGQLEPFGLGNAEPIFKLSRMRVMDAARLGQEQNHLRLVVADEKGNELKLMQFSAPEQNLRLEPGAIIDATISLTENEFRGIRSVEGRIIKLNFY